MNPVLVSGLTVWVVVGCVVAIGLHRSGHDAPSVALAVGAWPLFLPQLQGPPAGRVQATIDRLDRAARGVGPPLDLTALRASLEAAEVRLRRLDALLAEEPDSRELVERRAAEAAALDRSLAELAEIRLEFVLMSVDPPDRRPLEDLRARLRAAAEVT